MVRRRHFVRLTDKRLSMGINVSILVIITIFAVLLFLPLRLLFDTSYSDQDQKDGNVSSHSRAREKEPVIPIDHRKLKRCPNLQYEDRLISVFLSDYDENCTYEDDDECDDDDDDDDDDDNSSEEEEDSGEDEDDNEKTCVSKRRIEKEMKVNAEEILKTRQMKSVTVAGHILVAMLLVSVVAALIEVLRIRFARDKDSSRAGTILPRRCSSSVDLPATSRLTLKESIRSQRSFDIPGTPRSTSRLGARPPPLNRRSSFPTPQAKQAATSSACGTPNRRDSRDALEEEEEVGIVINTLHHRTRLIRRH